jgi:hypothetical protein
MLSKYEIKSLEFKRKSKPVIFVIFVLIILFLNLYVHFALVIPQFVVDKIVQLNAKITKYYFREIQIISIPFYH